MLDVTTTIIVYPGPPARGTEREGWAKIGYQPVGMSACMEPRTGSKVTEAEVGTQTCTYMPMY
eukprot:1147450-Pelagomonas_calceolata.AAC.1